MHVRPKYILVKDGVSVYANFPMSGKFCPLHSNLYSYSEDPRLIKSLNNRARGCSNPTKTSKGLPRIYVLPKYILVKDGVSVHANFPMSGKLLPLHGNL
jgi:hypothetical protein